MRPFLFVVVLGLVILVPHTAKADSKLTDTYITDADIDACLAANLPAWKEKLAAQPHPRLYFAGAAAVAKFKAAMQHPDAEQTKLLADLKAAADGMVKAPLVQYKTPEEYAATGKITIWHAQGELWERPIGDGMVVLALAGLLWDSPEYNAKLKQVALLACQYTSWSIDSKGLPNTDLPAEHIARGIAIAYDWHPDIWSPDELATIKKTLEARVNNLLDAAKGTASFWGRAYDANHEHNGISGIGITGAAFFGETPSAERWLAAAKITDERIAAKTAADGSSPEGIPYWSYGMSFLLSYIECTKSLIGSDELYQSGYFKNIGAYRLYSSTSDLSKTLPWGDAPARDFYGPHHILFRVAAQYREPGAQWLGENLPFAPQGYPDVKAWALLWYDPTVPATPPVVLDHRFPVGQMATTRSGWGTGDYLVALKAGKTNANHSHLDAGAIAFAFGSDWLMTAPGYGKAQEHPEYWDSHAKRWTYYSNATEAESTLLINGSNQRFDPDAQGVITDFLGGWKSCWSQVDLSTAYKDITSAARVVIHRRNDYLLVVDRVEAPQSVTSEWLLQAGGEITAADGGVDMKSPSGTLHARMIAPASPFAPRTPTSPNVDNPDPIHTYAVSQQGGSQLFACLLQPCFAKDAAPVIGSKVLPTDKDVLGLELQLGHAIDLVTVRKTTGPIEIAVPGQAAKVKATGLSLIAEWADGKVSSLSGQQLQSATWPGCSLTFTNPTTFSLEHLANKAWVFDLATPASVQLVMGKTTKQLVGIDDSGKQLSAVPLTGSLDLTAGRYLVLPPGVDLASTLDEMKKELPPHESPAMTVIIHSPKPQPPVPAATTMTIKAVDFQGQNATTESVTKPGADGKVIKGFGDEADQWISWKWNVATAGRYHLSLRYCTLTPNLQVTFLLDGAAVSAGAINIPLPLTGGWSSDADNWKSVQLASADGHPVEFSLSAGPHELRLVRPSGPLNIDQLNWTGAGF